MARERLSKRDQIRRLSAAGKTSREIAALLDYDIGYVCTTLWCDRHPDYQRRWMRKRRRDAAYRRKELDQQAEYYRNHRAGDPVWKRKNRALRERWVQRNREYVREYQRNYQRAYRRRKAAERAESGTLG